MEENNLLPEQEESGLGTSSAEGINSEAENGICGIARSECSESSSTNPTQNGNEGYVPKSKYEAVLYRVYSEKGVSDILKVASISIVALTAFAFFVHVLELVLINQLLLLETLIITGVPFIALSVMRIMVNAPRPYEVFEFYEKRPKGKLGRSFPSRHVFSVFVIGTVILPSNIVLGLSLIGFGIMLSVFRVLLGIHFIRDVVAGALIGVISGAVGHIVISLI